MTPSARVAAAIEILDLILDDAPAEKVLTHWGRRHRYAGSGDRAAIRDHVFSALRCKRSYGHLGGADSGRGLMLGWAAANGLDTSTLYGTGKYAPPALSESEMQPRTLVDASRGVRLDCPDWLLAKFVPEDPDKSDAILASQQARAPVYLRVNLRKSDIAAAQEKLLETGIVTVPHGLSKTALEVVENPRRVSQNSAYIDGLVELQDAASQAVVDLLPLSQGQRMLDYCAGGGGKSLAMAARLDADITAHDLDPARMQDIAARALRAGVSINIAQAPDIAGQVFDLVLCDVPCSGSGSWRRSPDAKWALDPGRLLELVETQSEIMNSAALFVAKNGVLAYVTCSLFAEENTEQIARFIAENQNWTQFYSRQFSPLEGGDGFFLALLKRV